MRENYRNAKPIQKLIRHFQSKIKEDEGYPKMADEILDNEKLPPPLKPYDFNGSVLWVPVTPSTENEGLEKIYSILNEIEKNSSISILHTNEKSYMCTKS